LQIDLRGELREGAMRGFTGAGTHGDEVLRHGVELPFEEWIGMVSVRGEGAAVSLPLAEEEVREHGNADAAAHIARETADAGDLVEFVLRHPT